MEILAVNAQTKFHCFPNSKNIVPQGPCINVIVPCRFSKGKYFSFNMGWSPQRACERSSLKCRENDMVRCTYFFVSRTNCKQLFAIKAVSAGLEDTQVCSQFQEFSVTICTADKANKLKLSIEVSGQKTQEIFDDVFSRMVAEAQPIPGFRRVKGGKTPNIPKDVLLEVLGPSKVYKQVIKRVINSTISEYVQKEGLSVAKDLQVEQSFEDLEAMFEPGDPVKFEATLQCQD